MNLQKNLFLSNLTVILICETKMKYNNLLMMSFVLELYDLQNFELSIGRRFRL